MKEQTSQGEHQPRPPLVIRRPDDPGRLDELSQVAELFKAQVYAGTEHTQSIEEIMIGDYHTTDLERRLRKTDAMLQWFVLDHVLTYGELDAEEFVEAVCESEGLEGAFLSFRRHNPTGLQEHARAATRFVDDLIAHPL